MRWLRRVAGRLDSSRASRPPSDRARLSLESLDDRALPSAVAADFGAAGVWRFDGASWAQLSTGDAEQIVPVNNSYDTFFADFGAAGGLWSWSTGGGWAQLSGGNAEMIMAGDAGAFVDFGADGLWNYGANGWAQLSGSNAEMIAGGNGGVFADFGANGVYRWTPGDGWAVAIPASVDGIYADNVSEAWVRLNPGGAAYWQADTGLQIVNAGVPEVILPLGNGTALADLEEGGLVRLTSTGTEVLTGLEAGQLAANPATGEAYIDFGPQGLFRYGADGSLALISSGDASRLQVTADGTLFADFGASGYWMFGAGGWQQVSTGSAVATPEVVPVAPTSVDPTVVVGTGTAGDTTGGTTGDRGDLGGSRFGF